MASNVLTIGALNRYIKYLLNNNEHLNSVRVVGEISNYTPRADGHMYFTLKDSEARIKCVMFSNSAKKVLFSAKNGDNVVINGKVDVYAVSGEYQIIVSNMELDGEGDLLRKYQELKERLEKEGLFDSSKKRLIPRFPKKIGVITAASGAAVRDVIATIENRYRLANIYVFDTIVQGENSVSSILNSLELSLEYDLDVIIIGRGGGSIEDLWSFNSEAVVRKISEINIPIISAVGHETDTTLCDFVCDKRAETPTAAAVMATPDAKSEAVKFHNLDNSLNTLLKGVINKYRIYTEKHSSNYFNTALQNRIVNSQSELLMCIHTFEKSYSNLINNRKQMLEGIDSSKLGQFLSNKLSLYNNDLNANVSAINSNYIKLFNSKISSYNALNIALEQLNPLKILSRGYSISYSGSSIVKSVNDVKDDLTVVLADGEVKIDILKKEVKTYE